VYVCILCDILSYFSQHCFEIMLVITVLLSKLNAPTDMWGWRKLACVQGNWLTELCIFISICHLTIYSMKKHAERVKMEDYIRTKKVRQLFQVQCMCFSGGNRTFRPFDVLPSRRFAQWRLKQFESGGHTHRPKIFWCAPPFFCGDPPGERGQEKGHGREARVSLQVYETCK